MKGKHFITTQNVNWGSESEVRGVQKIRYLWNTLDWPAYGTSSACDAFRIIPLRWSRDKMHELSVILIIWGMCCVWVMLRETHKQILIQASVGHWPSVLTQLCAQAATSLPTPGFYTMRKLGYIIDPHLNSGIPLSHHNLSPLLLSHPRAITALTTQQRSHLNPPSRHAHARGETGPQTGSPRLRYFSLGCHITSPSLSLFDSLSK